MGGLNGSERGAQFKIVSFHAIVTIVIVIGFLRGKPKDSWGTLGKIRGITTPGPLRILLY